MTKFTYAEALAHTLNWWKVKTYKETQEGLIAIHKRSEGRWVYFRWNERTGFFDIAGSTERYERD